MKGFKKILSIVLVFVILILAGIPSLAAESKNKFTDVNSTSWYYTAVNKLVELEITSGVGNNKFAPNNSVTRAEFVTFLCRAIGQAQEDGYTFTDTQKLWASKWIAAAVTANIIDKGTTFNPNKPITRLDAVEMLCRVLNFQADTIMQTPYTDVTSNSGYSNTAFKEYLMQGSIENNRRYFKPSSSITRAETAAVIVNLVDYKANPDTYKALKKAENDKQQSELDKYQEWLKTLDKGVSKELLTNNVKLTGGKTPYESHQLAMKEMSEGYWKGWMKDTTATNGDEFAKLCLENARQAVNVYYNMDYRKSDELEKKWTEIMSYNFNYAYAKDYLEDIKTNNTVMEGQFYTGLGLVTYNDDRQPSIRGTVRYRYLSPSIAPEGKKGNVWYEDDIVIYFYPEDTGLKVAGWTELSETRIIK